MTTRRLTLLVHGQSKSGKALALDTPVPTPQGWKNLGDLKEGDDLFGDDGNVTQVVALGPVYTDRKCYEIKVKGDTLVADANHVWKSSRNLARTADWRLAETQELANIKTRSALPWTPELQMPEALLSVDPYIAGAWLGDGTTSASDITAGKDGLFVLQKCLDIYGSGYIREVRPDYFLATLPGLYRKLMDAGFIADGRKCVPDYYLRSSSNQRRALLAGLIDTDGTVCNRGMASFANTNRGLADACAELSSSLGIRAYVRGPFKSAYLKNGIRTRGKDHYVVVLRGVVKADNVVTLPYKQDRLPKVLRKRYSRLYIESVSEVPSVPTRCIQVSAPNGMFLVGRSMIPTHNSWLADTAPGPRLVLDAESGFDYSLSKITYWNPTTEKPPEHDDTWDTCVVNVLAYSDVVRAYEWLNSGQHPFNSVVLDSVSEIQQRCVDQIAGLDQMKTQQWGELLRTVSSMIRQFRDLKNHPVKPLWAVVFVAMTESRDGKWAPLVQGKLKFTLPYYVDVCGWLFKDIDETGQLTRKLLIDNNDKYEAGERVGGRLGTMVVAPNISEMLKTLNSKETSNG